MMIENKKKEMRNKREGRKLSKGWSISTRVDAGNIEEDSEAGEGLRGHHPQRISQTLRLLRGPHASMTIDNVKMIANKVADSCCAHGCGGVEAGGIP